MQLKLVLQSNLKDIASVHQTFAKPEKFPEILDIDIIFIDNYNSRKRTIETKFKASKINDFDLLMTMIYTFTGVTAAAY